MVREEDWKDILRLECEKSSKGQMAARLGVSRSMVGQSLSPKYPDRDSAIKWLVLADAIGADLSGDDWRVKLQELCSLFSPPQVARFLGVNYWVVNNVLAGNYPCNALKLKGLVLFKYQDALDNLIPLSVGKRQSYLKDNHRKLLGIIDYIFCNPLCSHEEIVNFSSGTSKYTTRKLNELVAIGAVKRVEKFSPNHRGRDPLIKKYKTACGCMNPGLSDSCRDCPLGRVILSLEAGLIQQEELQDAC